MIESRSKSIETDRTIVSHHNLVAQPGLNSAPDLCRWPILNVEPTTASNLRKIEEIDHLHALESSARRRHLGSKRREEALGWCDVDPSGPTSNVRLWADTAYKWW